MTIGYKLLTQGVSQAVQSFVSDVDIALVALGTIGMQDVILTRLEDLGKRPRLRLTLSYSTPGPLQMRAAYFGITSGPQAPDVQSAAFFAATPLARAAFIRDVGNEMRGQLDSNAIMVIYGTTPLTNCGQGRARPMIVQALAPIAAGAAGSAQMVSSTGLVAGAVVSIVNRFDTTWATGARGYAIARAGSCIMDGFKTCC